MFRIFTVLCCLCSALAAWGESYNFFMISDPHLGAAETYCTDPKVPRRYRTKKDIHRADKVMPVYEALFADIARKTDSSTRFVIEAGDLIEGGTPNEKTHKKVLEDALLFMQKHFKKLPIYMVKGNHEAFGLGGDAAYNKILVPAIARYAGKEKLEYANYAVTCGKDLFIFIDYYPKAQGYDFILKTLASLKTKPRYVFVTLHAPLFPYSGVKALALLEKLTEYNAVILAGHCHANTVTAFEKNGKKVVQVTVSTFVAKSPVKKQQLTDIQSSPQKMTEGFRNKMKRKNAAAVLPDFDKNWAPYFTEHRQFKGTGYARINVSGKEVSVSFQSVDLTQKPITVKLISK